MKDTRWTRSASGNGSGCRTTAENTLKMAVVAPMPRARVRTATAVKSGFFMACLSGERDVLVQLAPPLAAPLVPVASLGDRPALATRSLEVAEAPLGGEAGRPRREAALHQLARAHLDMELELVLHLAPGGGTQQPGKPFESHAVRRGAERGRWRPRTRPRPSSRGPVGRGRPG